MVLRGSVHLNLAMLGLVCLLLAGFSAGLRGEQPDRNDMFSAFVGYDAYQFSPLHEGDLGRVRLYAAVTHLDAAAIRQFGRIYTLCEIKGPNGCGEVVRTHRANTVMDDQGVATGEFYWDGRDDNGELVPPGKYEFTFKARFVPEHRIRPRGGLMYEDLLGEAEEAYEEAENFTREIIVNYNLSEEWGRYIRLMRATGACQIQQNTPLLSGFGYNFYYGSIHSHSNYSDGGQNTSSCTSGASYGSGSFDPAGVYNYARNEAGMDFWVVTDHNHLFEEAVSNSNPPLTEAKVKARYQAGLTAAQNATVNDAFVALFGQEWGVLTNSDQGHVIVMESPKLFGWDSCSTCGTTQECTPGTNCYFDVYVPKRYNYLTLYAKSVQYPSAAGALGSLCHPSSGHFDNFAYNANADAAMQSIAVVGGPAFALNTTCDVSQVGSTYFSQWMKALNIGFHVGPSGEQDAHCNNYGIAVPTRMVYLLPNGTSPVLTRAAIMNAHRNRHFYATEDPNIQLVFKTSDNAHIMGDIFTASGSVTLNVAVNDPDGEPVSTIALYRGQIGAGALTSAYQTVSGQSTYSITESFTSGTYYYFVKATQSDGHDVYSAPMWITFSGAATYSIAGSAGTAGATVTAGSATATADSSGNYTLTGLSAGTYTVTPSKSGCTFSPTSLSVTVGPNATGKNFTANCGTTTYSIAGSAGTSGVTVTAGSATATSDSSGNYTLTGLVAGTYTVTPSKSGCTFSPASLSVTVGPSATGKNFTANCGGGDTQLTSGVALTGQSVALSAWKYYYITVPAGATSLAFATTSASADVDIYTQVNAKPTSSSYICRPYSSSGNETCTASNPAAGTWWVGVYGYKAATFSITATLTQGTTTYSIAGSAGTSGVTVTAGSASTTSDSSGNYTLTGLAAGTYTVTPSKSGCTFSPTSLSVTVGPSATGKNFTATCGSGDTQLSNGVALTGQSVASGAWKYYYITVPSGATSLELKTTGATADIDIYTQVNAKPTSSSYVCRPYSGSGNETCTQSSPTAGTWWIGVYGYAAGSFTVTGTYTSGGGSPVELVLNGGFETITASTNTAPDGSWTRSAYTGTSFNTLTANGTYPHAGTDHAYLGVNNNSSQTLDSKLITIPSTATSATLTFWVSVVTNETGTTAYDKMLVLLVNSSGSTVATLATLSNLDKTSSAGTYVQKTYNVTSYKGQSLKIRFKATLGSSYTTTFRVDDVSLIYQ